jgi:hypothetical protein
MLVPQVRVVRCAPKSHPCPCCGTPARRVRPLRRLYSLACQRPAYVPVHSAEYKTRCGCRKTFRCWPLDVTPRSRTASTDKAPDHEARLPAFVVRGLHLRLPADSLLGVRQDEVGRAVVSVLPAVPRHRHLPELFPEVVPRFRGGLPACPHWPVSGAGNAGKGR